MRVRACVPEEEAARELQVIVSDLSSAGGGSLQTSTLTGSREPMSR